LGEAKGSPADDAIEGATEAEDKRVALIIAILALFLALAEAAAKKADHHSTEQNIESSDLFNFYQAKKLRSTIAETAAQAMEATSAAVTDEKARAAIEKQIADWRASVANFEKDAKHPEDSLDRIQERAKAAGEARELSNQKLEHFEYASGALQIAIVLASAAIITSMPILAWIAGLLGLLGGILMAFGYLAPTLLNFLG
jgi:hypothetical protein